MGPIRGAESPTRGRIHLFQRLTVVGGDGEDVAFMSHKSHGDLKTTEMPEERPSLGLVV